MLTHLTLAGLLLALPQEAGVPAPAEEESAVSTLEHFETFGKRVERSVNAFRPAFVNKSFDLDALVARALEGLELPNNTREGFVEGFTSTFGYGHDLCASIDGGGSLKFLRVRITADGSWALFRLIDEDGGFKYEELRLILDGEGTVRVVDAYDYLLGERMSSLVRRGAETLVDVDESGRSSNPGHATLLDSGDSLSRMKLLVLEQEWGEAYLEYLKLPTPVRALKRIMIEGVLITSGIGDDGIYLRAIENFEAAYPDDPALDLILFDAHILRGELDRAFAVLTQLEERVGGDPYLNCLRGGLYTQLGEWDSAARTITLAIEHEPTLEEAFWARAELALATENWRLLAETLTTLEDNFGYRFKDLATVSEYAGFVQSEEYGTWIATRADAPAPRKRRK